MLSICLKNQSGLVTFHRKGMLVIFTEKRLRTCLLVGKVTMVLGFGPSERVRDNSGLQAKFPR